jgi:hypothetical protein
MPVIEPLRDNITERHPIPHGDRSAAFLESNLHLFVCGVKTFW